MRSSIDFSSEFLVRPLRIVLQGNRIIKRDYIKFQHFLYKKNKNFSRLIDTRLIIDCLLINLSSNKHKITKKNLKTIHAAFTSGIEVRDLGVDIKSMNFRNATDCKIEIMAIFLEVRTCVQGVSYHSQTLQVQIFDESDTYF